MATKEQDLSLANPMGVSGRFLDDPDTFQKIYSLWVEYKKLKKALRDNGGRLRNCNNPVWLYQFAGRCRRSKRDPKTELPALAARLESDKREIVARMAQVWRQMMDLEPSVQEVSTETLAWPANPVRMGRIKSPDVASRNAVIDAHSDRSDREICQLLDVEFPATDGAPRELPDSWFRDFGVRSFSEALARAECKHRVHKMISLRRQRRSPE